MSEPAPMRRAVDPLLPLAGLFLVLCLPFLGFVIDDAFVTFRYAANLLGHGTLAWNVGEPPVEGFTSAAWLLLVVAGDLVGLDPRWTATALGVLATLATLGVLARVSADRRGWPTGVALAVLAASPAFAVLSVQGLETSLAVLATTLVGAAALAVDERPSPARATALHAAAFAAGLVRPDALLVAAVVEVGVLLRRRSDRDALRTLLVAALPFVAAGVVYEAWRWITFGRLVPNTFAVKAGAHALRWATRDVLTFLLRPALPAVVGLVALLRAAPAEARGRVVPLLAGSAVFLAWACTLHPLQGYLWRYLFPAAGPALVALAALPGPAAPRRGLVIAALLWELTLLGPARREVAARPPDDRIAAGRALAGLDGTMLVTEAGAVPFYSGWRALDARGLVDDRVAHRGLTLPRIRELHPDVVLMLDPRPGESDLWPVIDAYLEEEGFEVLTVLPKHDGQLHAWFVRPSSPVAADAARRLRALPTALSSWPEATARGRPTFRAAR